MGVTFIAYIAAAFVVMLGIALIVLLISKKNTDKTKDYRTLVGFAVVILLVCLLYSFFYFREVVLQVYEMRMPLRIIDYVLYGLLLMFWLRVLGRLLESNVCGGKSLIMGWSWIVGALSAGIGVFATVFFMDNHYCFLNYKVGVVYTIFEAILVLGTATIIIKYSMDFVRESVNRVAKNYIIFVSLVIICWEIQQVCIDAKLYLGIYISAWANGEIDTVALAVFLLGFATFLFLFREDFSPLFYEKTDLGSDDSIALIAVQHGLTTREVEVLRLLYEGKNNPEIGEMLFISRNTVKKHVKSIFEKTGVNSRMELSYLINQKEKHKSTHLGN